MDPKKKNFLAANISIGADNSSLNQDMNIYTV